MIGDLLRLRAALGGEIHGSSLHCPTIGHSTRDRGTSYTLKPSAPGGILATVRNGCGSSDDLAAKDRAMEILGRRDQWALGTPDPADARRRQEARERDEKEARAQAEDRRDFALATWAKAVDPRGTAVDAHLGGRCLDLSDEIAGAVLRFHPRCPWGRGTVPAMVALVRDVLTDAPIGIHRTALDDHGRKVVVDGHSRLALGAVAGGAVKLTPDADVATCLGIGEGIESTLSLRQTEFGASPVWALISASGIEALPVLSGIECLWIAVDNDPAGLRAAKTCAARWRAAGRETFRLTPDAPGADLNDIIQGKPGRG